MAAAQTKENENNINNKNAEILIKIFSNRSVKDVANIMTIGSFMVIFGTGILGYCVGDIMTIGDGVVVGGISVIGYYVGSLMRRY